ncbi:MAG: curli production assembly protein CsgG [Acidobacteria bacterium]|nr:curli production assembly protein CsgG [Acidobacteriota bacterium]MCI0622566.1 curli production assembly protein CsgG [Acidobacteriota bacterium]MCI0720823.1 curli production assembly protein CsgG [Acidobacteriota bacterium]
MTKNTIRFHGICLAVGLMVLLLDLTCWAAPAKKRVSVMDFEFGTVQRWWDGNWDIGKGISDLLVDRLISEGTFSVIERRKLDMVLAEQNFSNSERADSSTAARVGKVLGVNAIILGSITQFGTERKDFNAAGIGGGRGGLGAGRVGTREGKAAVAVTARLIDINTGEVLASSTGRGQSSRSGLLLGGLVIGSGGFGAGSVNMNSSQFRETILGEATYAAVNDLSRQLALFGHKIPSSSSDIRGLVADVSGNSVIVNIGRAHGLEAGTTLNVLRVNRTVKDPATGKPLREMVTEVGRVRIDEADNDSSTGTIISGNGIKLGDLVRNR